MFCKIKKPFILKSIKDTFQYKKRLLFLYKNWLSFIQKYSFSDQQKLAPSATYFQDRNLENVQIVFINDECAQTYRFSPTNAESIIIVSSNIQITIEDANDVEQEVNVDIILLDEVQVNFFVNQHNAKSNYRFFLGFSAKLYFFLAVVDVQPCTIKVVCHVLGANALAVLQGVYVLNKSQAMTLFTEQHHHVPHTQSDLSLRGFVTDDAKSIHQGIITIDGQAQQTKASQYNKTLLGSMHAQAKSVPSLEIKAHDVRCQHGSAIGYLDEQQLFYLQSRGLNEYEAQKTLVEAFFSDSNEFLQDAIQKKLKKLFS